MERAEVRRCISTSPLFELRGEGPEDSEDRGGYWIYVGQDEDADAVPSSPAVAILSLSNQTESMPNTAEGLPAPTANPFVFPQATLYPRHSSASKHYVAIPECFSPDSPRGRPANFIGAAALGTGHLLLQLVVRIYDKLDVVTDNKSSTSLGAAGASASAVDVGPRSGYRSRATSSAGGWSVLDDDDVFDSDDGEMSYLGRGSELGDAIADDASALSDF